MGMSAGMSSHDEYRETRGEQQREFWATVIGVAAGYIVSKIFGL